MKKFKTKAGTELIISDIKGKDYMQVQQRIIWFREEHPDWSIETEITRTGNETLAKATIKDATGRIMATSHKVEDKQGFSDHTEKGETGAIGRALALCGYGTQFAGSELDEGARLADSPISGQRSEESTAFPPPLTEQEFVDGMDHQQTGKPHCPACGGEMWLRKDGTKWFCPNYKKSEQCGRSSIPA